MNIIIFTIVVRPSTDLLDIINFVISIEDFSTLTCISFYNFLFFLIYEDEWKKSILLRHT